MKLQLFSEDQELQATVHLDREKQLVDRITYSVVTPGSSEGYVHVELRDLDYFQERGEPVADAFSHHVYDDVIAEITHFFPHQVPIAERIPRQFARKGIGTSVLTTVLRDLFHEEDVRHFYVNNPATPFYNLLMQNRFRELRVPEDAGNEHLYRKLKRK